MNILNRLILLSILALGAGCRSDHTQASSTTISRQVVETRMTPETVAAESLPQISQAPGAQHGSTGNLDYTVEILPNTRLTPTSREGDKPEHVYSSNIIAVYVHPRGVTVSSTNAPADPNQANNPERENK